MGRLLKLAIVGLVIYGGWQSTLAQWDHFKLGDSVRQLTEFRAEQPEEEVRTMVVAEAAKLGIGLDPARVNIQKVADRLRIDARYARPVNVLPWYRYNWPFELKVEIWSIPNGRLR
jgi:hypothetical protein